MLHNPYCARARYHKVLDSLSSCGWVDRSSDVWQSVTCSLLQHHHASWRRSTGAFFKCVLLGPVPKVGFKLFWRWTCGPGCCFPGACGDTGAGQGVLTAPPRVLGCLSHLAQNRLAVFVLRREVVPPQLDVRFPG